MALINKKNELCIFLIQNGCNVKLPIKEVEKKEVRDLFYEINKSVILPRSIYEKYSNDDAEFNSYSEYVAERLKIKD